jgi:hypothetical protein
MKTYTIDRDEVHTVRYEVKARSPQEAMQKLWDGDYKRQVHQKFSYVPEDGYSAVVRVEEEPDA